MKNNLKVALVLVIVLTFYSIIVYIVAAKNNDKKPENPIVKEPKPDTKNEISNIIISPNTRLNYKNGKWFENSNIDLVDKLFNVYIDGIELGERYLSYDDGWFIFDDYKNFEDYDGSIFAFNGDYDINVMELNKLETSDNDKALISAFLEEKGITFDYSYLMISKYSYDFNQDGTPEDMYSVSNAFTDSPDFFNEVFGFVFVHYSGQNKVIYESSLDINQMFSTCNPRIQNLININNNQQLVVSCTYFSERGTEHSIYDIKGENFTKLITTNIK